MPVSIGMSADDMFAILPIHFDVPAHSLPLDTFIRTAEQAKNLFDALNNKYYDGALHYEILVLPPAEGSFKAWLGFKPVTIVGGFLALLYVLESDMGKGFVKGLTLHPPEHWTEMAGSAIRKKIQSNVEQTGIDAQSDTAAIDETMCLAATTILVESTINFLQSETATLGTKGLKVERFQEGYAARNEFYKACAALPTLKAIGFEEAPIFPIKRSDFSRLTVPLPPIKDDDDVPWLTGIAILKVTSPNWKQNDRQRQWVAEDSNGKERHFKIEDQGFWDLVPTNRLKVTTVDIIKVQWAYQGSESNPKKIRVLRVLQFNDQILADPLDENALSAIIGAFTDEADAQKGKASDPRQGVLFPL